jgi:ABC-type lipoprotein release transport system permease subunit
MTPLVATYLKIGAAVVPAVAFLVWRGVLRLKQSTRPRRRVVDRRAPRPRLRRRLPVRRPGRHLPLGALQASGASSVRFATLAAGVVFLIFLLSALLPLILDALERRSFSPFVGARHVRATKSGFLTVISVLSMAGVAVSSCALCSVTSIMGGFGADLKRKILNNNAHIIVDVTRPGGFDDWEGKLEQVRAGARAPTAAAPPRSSAATRWDPPRRTRPGVLVRGIDPETIGKVIDLAKNIEVGQFEYLSNPEKLTELPAEEVIWNRRPRRKSRISRGPDLAAPDIDPELCASSGSSLKVPPGVILGTRAREEPARVRRRRGDAALPDRRARPHGRDAAHAPFRVAAIFYSGMYEYDASHAYILIDRPEASSASKDKIARSTRCAFRRPEGVSDAEKHRRRGPSSARRIEPASAPTPRKGAELRARDWKEMNKNLFSALKLEKIATFIILSIAIAVASFCIVCTLLLMVTEKGKEIAILKALGASDGAIMRIFMLEGVDHRRHRHRVRRGHRARRRAPASSGSASAPRSGRLLHRSPPGERDPADYGLVALAAMSSARSPRSTPPTTAADLTPSTASLRVTMSRRRRSSSCEDLHKTFFHMGRQLEVLRGIDLTIPQGDVSRSSARPAPARARCCTASARSTCPRGSHPPRPGDVTGLSSSAQAGRTSATARSASSSSSTTSSPSSTRSRT